MRKLLLLAALAATSITSFAQDTTSGKWTTKVNTQLNFSQSSFTNWSGGGEDAISTTGLFSLVNKYKGAKSSLENRVELAYGLLKQEDKSPVKTDDRLELSSKYSKPAFGKFNYSSILAFRSQFAPGYANPEDTNKVSDFMAPGYGIASIGLDYKPNDHFSLMVSPFTGKFTIVADEMLSDAGAYGVDPGKMFRAEIGGYLRIQYQQDVVKNVNLSTKVEVFSNYLENPQNLDINWENVIAMKVNKHISANISTQLIYDDDIDISLDRDGDGVDDGSGPRVQFKEVLSIGLTYSF